MGKKNYSHSLGEKSKLEAAISLDGHEDRKKSDHGGGIKLKLYSNKKNQFMLGSGIRSNELKAPLAFITYDDEVPRALKILDGFFLFPFAALCWLVIMFHLKKIFEQFNKGVPFSSTVARSLKIISMACIAAGFVELFSFKMILCGIVILILSRVFLTGAELVEEQKLVI